MNNEQRMVLCLFLYAGCGALMYSLGGLIILFSWGITVLVFVIIQLSFKDIKKNNEIFEKELYG